MRGIRLLSFVRAIDRRDMPSRLLRASVLLLGAAGLDAAGTCAPGLKGETAVGIVVEARVVGTEYCALTTSDDLVSLSVTVQLVVRNTTLENLIIARNPTNGAPIVAADGTRGTAGFLEFEWPSWDTYATAPPLQLTDVPDPNVFLVLKPGDSFTTSVHPMLPVYRGTQKKRGSLAEASEYAIQVPIEWWAPLFEASDIQITDVQKRWRQVGKLIVGTSTTDWITFVTPAIQVPKVCS